MGTDLQLSPNGRQALKPILTGPREKRAKGRTSHGRFVAMGVILFDETEEDFNRHYSALHSALCPRDALEEVLVERIAISAWRLNRIYRIETGLFSRARVSLHRGKLRRTNGIELVFLRLTAHDDDIAKLMLYERSLDRSLRGALGDLKRHRGSWRKGRHYSEFFSRSAVPLEK